LRPAILATLDEVVSPLSEAERNLLREFIARIVHADEMRERS